MARNQKLTKVIAGRKIRGTQSAANELRPFLRQTIERLDQHFRADPRCLGIYLWGSAGKGTEDAYSDVDIAIVVRDEDFAAIKAELPAIGEQFCGKIAVWLPEAASGRSCNFAFLFEADAALLLYDFSVHEFLRRRHGQCR